MDRLSLEIQLDLSGHCIETDIKKQYNRLISNYFKSAGDRDGIEKKISLLKHALETLDFRQLRNKHPELAGNTDDKVFLSWDDMKTLRIRINTTQVSP
jgi:glutamate formiminotransferase